MKVIRNLKGLLVFFTALFCLSFAGCDLLSKNLEIPTGTTEEQTTDPEDPNKDPEEPSTDPENPSTDPDKPSTDPENPGTDPEEPSTDPDKPSTDPENPSTEPEKNGVRNITLGEKKSGNGITLVATRTPAAKMIILQ